LTILPIDSGRYGSEEMRSIFNGESRLQKMLDVEAAVAYAHAAVGNIPREAAEEIAGKANIRFVKLERCREIEKVIHHDLMAVVQALTEVCEGEGGRWVHFGLTSYDVEDTATALQFKEATGIVERDLQELQEILLGLTRKYRDLTMAGRTHGQQMGVVTLGFKFAVWLREVSRHLERLRGIRDRVLVGKILGAVGTGAGLGGKALKIQEVALQKLGLKPADMVTQIVQRDVHGELVSLLVLVACSLDKFALEIRNLQRTEIQEVAEPFRFESQVGSTAMPAKRNPIKCERICSLAKLMRGLTVPAYENIALWNERDLTNSANERFIFPMCFILLDEMLKEMKTVLKGIEVYPENIRKNLELTGGLILSERVANRLVDKGMSRQEAHELVRLCSMKAIKEKIEFRKTLLESKEVSSKLGEDEVDECLNPDTYLGVAPKLIDEAVAKTEMETKKRR